MHARCLQIQVREKNGFSINLRKTNVVPEKKCHHNSITPSSLVIIAQILNINITKVSEINMLEGQKEGKVEMRI